MLNSLRMLLIGLIGAALPVDGAESVSAAAPVTDSLEEVIVTAPEPRYVAPTRRDRIGRIWVPAYINDKGPFRLVLDTGATTSAITDAVAAVLNLPANQSPNVTLRGATGSVVVPTVKVDSLVVGDLILNRKRLPIIPNALGDAEGVLGTEGLSDKRVYIDFGSDLIVIKRSHKELAAPDFVTIPIKLLRGRLLTINAQIGSVRLMAIVDTGGQVTVANLAARNALLRHATNAVPTIDEIVGATDEIQKGERYKVPPIQIGDITIRNSHVTFSDMHIFQQWQLLDEPAILIGMDVLGTLDTLIIDYKRSELQLRVRKGN